MSYLASLLPLAAINAMLVLGLNFQYGLTGILNFTYITFVAIGAYVGGVLTLGAPNNGMTYLLGMNLAFPLNAVLGGVAAAVLGLVVSFAALRRLRSDYLAIVTVGAGAVVYTIIGNESGLFNGWNGIFDVPLPVPAHLNPAMQQVVFGLWCVIALGVVFFVLDRIRRSPLGRTLRAIREDEGVTEAFGRDTFSMRMKVFLVGCFVAGLGGALLVEYASAYNPSAFLPGETFILWAAMLIGGSGNNWGAILGALIVPLGFAEATRFLPTIGNPTLVQSLRGIAIGLLIVVVPLFLPQGILPEQPFRDRRPVPGQAPVPEGASVDA